MLTNVQNSFCVYSAVIKFGSIEFGGGANLWGGYENALWTRHSRGVPLLWSF